MSTSSGRTTSEEELAKRRRNKILVLGGIAAFVLGLFVFFSPWLGVARHRFNFLPYYGPKEVVAIERDGEVVIDTIYHRIPPFSFTDQYGRVFTDQQVEGKIIVADYFFTRCGTICPKMTVQMQQLQLKLNDEAFKDVVFLSHTVDPEHDTPEVLHEYARRHQADSARWVFLTGTKEALYLHGSEGYRLAAREEVMEPGGFLHSETFVLVDKDRHIRGMYDGTTMKGMNDCAADIKMLLKEEKVKRADAVRAERKRQ